MEQKTNKYIAVAYQLYTMENGKPRWADNCTQCMACIARCPKQAVEYGKSSVGKTRYVCRSFEG